MPIDLHSRVVRAKDPITAPVDEELVMADVDAGKYYGFDKVATTVWQLLEEEITVEDLCCRLQDLYDVPPERCAMDVLAFLGELEARGLVRPVEESV